MTRDDSQSCLAFSEEHSCMAFQSFIACIASMERFNLKEGRKEGNLYLAKYT